MTTRGPRLRVVGIVIASAASITACDAGSGAGADSTVLPTPIEVIVDTSEPGLSPSIFPVEVVGPGDDEPDDQAAKDVVTRAVGATESIRPEGYGSVTATITSAAGDVCEVCLWLADDDTTRQRGLMGVTDLGDAVGMAFRWDEPRTGNFFMFQTPTPLSIAWFDVSGSHVSEADMQPCLVDDSAVCERYTADAPYVLAVEMFGGQLEAIGIGPGASIELVDLPCTSIPG